MTTAVQRRRGTNTEHATFTGLDGEITVNTTTYTLHVHDGATVGGVALAKADGSNLVTSSIDINGGTIDGTVIGGSSAAAGTFTSITGTSANINGTVTADGLTVDNSSAANIYLDGTGTGRARVHSTYGILNLTADADSNTAGTSIKFKSGTTDRMLIDSDTGDISFYEDTGTTAKFFWDASAESLGIGTSSPSQNLHVKGTTGSVMLLETAGTTASPNIAFTNGSGQRASINSTTSADLFFTTGSSGTERMRIDSSGAVLIHPNNATRGLKITSTQTTAVGDTTTFDTIGAGYGQYIFKADGTERARLDSSGNLLVGKTATNSGTVGIEARATGRFFATADGAYATKFERLTSDGDIAVFTKDGVTVGSIGSSLGAYLTIGIGDTGLRFTNDATTKRIEPFDIAAGSTNDGIVDLGISSNRFDTVYAVTGTINTSDRNEKQDIESLSEAEQRVAVACKGLLRKFRWKSAVEEKGEDARIHFGIIAQDLQAAFEAEGLDAGRYGMFINSTWIDEETGEERSRMGVRYSELLAFIIAAI